MPMSMPMPMAMAMAVVMDDNAWSRLVGARRRQGQARICRGPAILITAGRHLAILTAWPATWQF